MNTRRPFTFIRLTVKQAAAGRIVLTMELLVESEGDFRASDRRDE